MIYNVLKSSIINIWPSLVIITVTMICARLGYLRNHRDSASFYKEFWMIVSIVYLLLLYELVTRVDYNTLGGGINLVPFAEISRYKINSEMFLMNVIGNILLFVPFGYIMASYIKPKTIWPNLVIALVVSITIETVQLNIGRSFDIDDIILNTLGCVIGYLIYIGFRAIKSHLPSIFTSKFFNNLICFILIGLVLIYLLKIMGVLVL